jgi:CRP/FNR family transcriptional regulator, nitrogen fixation regulation protein
MLAKTQAIDPRTGIATSYPSAGLLPRAIPSSGPAGSSGKASFLAPLEARAQVIQADRDKEIVAQEDPATHCYLVVSGCIRTTRLMEDGRRQVGEFLFAGDLFGWESLDRHDFGAEAVSPVTLRRYPRRDLENLADRDRDASRRLRELFSQRVRAGRDHMLLLGRKTAAERIASFLLEMAERIEADSRAMFELPMSRADMGDYLGLTIETVCRRLTQLRVGGTIAIEGTKVAICDRHALGAAGCERVVH